MISNFATRRILFTFVPINFICRSLYKHCYKIVRFSRECNVDLLDIKRITSSLNLQCPVKQFESRRKIMSSSGSKSQEVKLVSYEELNTLIHDKSAILIDVRERKELADTGVLPNSVNIPLGELEEALVNTPDDKFNEKYGISKPETSDKLVFSCRSGKRSLMATQKALAAGYCKYV
uniref:Rhodanese domain-containing protein n=1 Tax=Timema bartmani TaxID=61472 RepID=A0A7R9F4Q7_9NEOP|nr:unnamed protein product [Timema bartmani]